MTSMASAKSSWEGWATSWSNPTASETEHGEPEDLDYSDVSPEMAADELCAMLVDLKITNNLSAKQCCVLAWWAHKAGVPG